MRLEGWRTNLAAPVPNVRRIVSIAPSSTEILHALGLGRRIVGVDRWSDYPPRVLRLPQVGSDLRVDLPITLYEAVLGGKIRVPILGGAVELSIPKNTSSGRTFRLKGKGLPKASGGTGDLFVTTRIMLPDGNDAELETLMQKWRDGHPYNPRSDLG